MFRLSPKQSNGTYKRLEYHDGWLLTHPDEDFSRMGMVDGANEFTATDGGLTATMECPNLSRSGNIQVMAIVQDPSIHDNFFSLCEVMLFYLRHA